MPAAVAANPLPVPPFHGGVTEYSLHQTPHASGHSPGRLINHLSLSLNQLYQPSALDSSSNSMAPTSDPSHVSSHVHGRALARITSLEKTIEYVQSQHAAVLKGLYAEVAKLQDTCSDLSMKLIMSKSDGDSEVNGLQYSRNIKQSTAVNAAVQTDDGDASFHERRHFEDTPRPSEEEPQMLYVLLDQQRRKYTSVIERMNEDSKRKQRELDHLKAERELIKEALRMAGLQMKELQTLTGHCGRRQKHGIKTNETPVLPPIGMSTGHGITGQKQSGESKDEHPRQLLDLEMRGGASTPAPPSYTDNTRPQSVRARASTFSSRSANDFAEELDTTDVGEWPLKHSTAIAAESLVPEDQHDHLSSYRAPLTHKAYNRSRRISSTYSTASTDSGTTQTSLAELVFDDSKRLLPPLYSHVEEPTHYHDNLDEGLHKGSTKWSKRMHGAKLVREKQWRELNLRERL